LAFGIFSFTDQEGFQRLVVGPSGKWTQPLQVFRAKAEANQTLLRISMELGLCLQLNKLLHEESTRCQYESSTGTICLRCGQSAPPELYNQRVDEARQLLRGQDFFLRCMGREAWESGVIWVEKGKLKGVGFVPEDDFRSKEAILNHLHSYYDTQDAQSILRTWLEKARLTQETLDGIAIYEFDAGPDSDRTNTPNLPPLSTRK
jgi:DNA polymerase-3 subunit epsilon